MTTPATQAILPCPKCGGRAFIAPHPSGFSVWCIIDRCLRLPPRETRDEAITAWNTRTADALPGDVGMRAAQIADLIVSPDTAANDIQRQAYWHVAHEAAKLALGVSVGAPEDNPACTDCGDTGVTFQTERPCSCRAALAPSALSGDVGEGE